MNHNNFANYLKQHLLIFLMMSLLPVVVKCSNPQERPFIIDGFTQGTYYRVTYYATDSVVKKAEIENFLEKFLKTASLWEPNSIVSKINNNQDVELNDDFVKIFNVAQRVSKMGNGTFDITVGDLVNLWGFGNKEKEQPSQYLIDSLKQFVGYQNLELRNNRIYKKYPESTLNLNAIAKGYSVDLVSELLRSKGLTSFLVDIGGEIRAGDNKPGGKPWAVAIQNPTESYDEEGEINNVLLLTNKSIATSGTYRRYYLKDGVRYSHTIDPRTGYPVAHTLLSVTVIASDCVEADAVATVLMVYGLEESAKFLKNHPEYEAYFIYSGPDGSYKTVFTKGFAQYLAQ